MFDPTLKKKKKKKKTTFDMDSAFNEGGNTGGDAVESSTVDKENQEPEPAVIEEDEALDLENFGKKKKKKKKAFNLDELEAALPESKKEVKQIRSVNLFIDGCYFFKFSLFCFLHTRKI